MIRLDLTEYEFTALIAHFGIAVNLRMGRAAAHHHLAAQNLPREVLETLTEKLVEAMREMKRNGA